MHHPQLSDSATPFLYDSGYDRENIHYCCGFMSPNILLKAKEFFLQRPTSYTRSLFCNVGFSPAYLYNSSSCFSWQGKMEPGRICPPAYYEKIFRGMANFIGRSYVSLTLHSWIHHLFPVFADAVAFQMSVILPVSQMCSAIKRYLWLSF